ncbi:MAG: DUF4364 family protein [Clostridiales bacterium]|nr:DUF4364 family protein [Clostridiales bacterium]MDD7506686.1 DUF4364 family protein [Clostridiales bacterium]MDY5678273.1 DUF4364 family protein [Eubacteriales bacterium]MDY5726747.1 DUF4364 family protein [Eubacteriales bacterium]
MADFALDAAQNKLLLLFVFDKMEMPLTEDSLSDLCCNSNGWMNYMDFKFALTQLIEANFVYHTNKNSSGSPLYTITPEGRVCLAHFFVRLPSSLREQISNCVKVNRLNYRRKQEYFSDYHKNADGTYDVILKILEPTQQQPTLDLKINVPNRSIAKYIFTKWEDKAANAFQLLYDYLVSD